MEAIMIEGTKLTMSTAHKDYAINQVLESAHMAFESHPQYTHYLELIDGFGGVDNVDPLLFTSSERLRLSFVDPYGLVRSKKAKK